MAQDLGPRARCQQARTWGANWSLTSLIQVFFLRHNKISASPIKMFQYILLSNRSFALNLITHQVGIVVSWRERRYFLHYFFCIFISYFLYFFLSSNDSFCVLEQNANERFPLQFFGSRCSQLIRRDFCEPLSPRPGFLWLMIMRVLRKTCSFRPNKMASSFLFSGFLRGHLTEHCLWWTALLLITICYFQMAQGF